LEAVIHAVKVISARQVDNNKALEERRQVTTDLGAAGVPKAPEVRPVPVLLSSKPLSGKERKEALAALPGQFKAFLEDVEPIIADLERDTFLRLQSNYQRDRFIEEFWKRRSISPDGFRQPFKDIYELRLRYVREVYRHSNTDQGRIYLVNGPPDGIRRVNCTDIYWPVEIWYYERIESLKLSKVSLLFYQPFAAGDYRLWTPMDGPQAVIAGGLSGLAAPMPRRVDITRCPEWREIASAISSSGALLGGVIGSAKLVDQLRQGEKPDVEGVDRILQMTTDIDASSTRLNVQRLIRFPEQVGNKIRMELGIMFERAALAKKEMGTAEVFYDIDVIGEIVRGDKLYENFRYRFDFPASVLTGPFIPVTIERDLYPGEYRLKVKLSDANQNAAALIDETIRVPETPDVTFSAEEKAARQAARTTVAKLVANPDMGKGSISLLPISREFATGLIRFETRVTSPDIAYVEFLLNGSKIVTRRRPPFEADLDLGELPRKHTVKVIGYGKDGRSLAQDELILNEGREAFRVRILSPERGVTLAGATRITAEVTIPDTKKLKSVEFWVNDNRVAAVFQPPFTQVVDIPKSKELGYIRAVAILEDDTSTEDLHYFNAPKYLSEVSVQAVELYTSVFAGGRPVIGLTQEAFTVSEDGVKQTIDGFEVVKNLPLTLGIGIDTSGSMEESLVEAQKAASGFIDSVMTKRDRAFLLSFDSEPQLLTRPTSDKPQLNHAIAGLRAHGSTALWDAIVYGLYQYQGVKGRKAYVILSDGEDRASKFTYEAALDYARKSGVALYFIGLRIKGLQMDVRSKLNKLAKETGGTVYYIDVARNLASVYKEIDEELRNQYLLTYVPQAKPDTDKWRKIEVKMTPDNLTARTISGYYP
jgi:VWFA-related protein